MRLIKNRDLKSNDATFSYSGPFDHAYLVHNGDVLVGMDGDFAPCIWRDGTALLNQRVGRLLTSPRLNSIYAYYALTKPLKAIETVTSSTTVKHLSHRDVENIVQAIPPLSEQNEIAAALSDIDGLIRALDELIAKKRDIKQAAAQSLLTATTRLPGFSGEWSTKPLGDVASINMGQSPDSRYYNSNGRGTPLIQGNADIEDGATISRVWTTHITKACGVGEVILTVRAPVGAVAIASAYSCLGRGVCVIRGWAARPEFLFHALSFTEPRWKALEQGSTFTAANSAQIAQFPIAVAPTEKEQAAVARVLSDLDAEIRWLQSRRDKTTAVKRGMAQALLTGRVRLVATQPVAPA